MNISIEDAFAIDNYTAKFLGQGDWKKNSAYQVFQVEDRYIAVVVDDQMSQCVIMETAEYITKDEIEKYI